MGVIFHKCPTCGADEDKPCRTPNGRIRRASAGWRSYHKERTFTASEDDETMIVDVRRDDNGKRLQ